MKGYKAFNRVEGSNTSGTCRGMLFEEGNEYSIEGTLEICRNGLHFCKHLVQTFEYYEFNHNSTIYAEVEAIGALGTEDVLKFKYATDNLKIIRFMDSTEVDALFSDDKQNTGDDNTGHRNTGDCNTGYYNTGYRNTGNSNTGDYNTGYWNTGYRNTGNRNTGDYNTGSYNTGSYNTGSYNTGDYNTGNRNTGNLNTGDYNTGDYNTGYRNTGDYNTGNSNTGDYNTGDWNKSDRNNGFFNTKLVEEVLVFNKPCLLSVWESANKPNFLYFSLLDSGDYKESFIASFNKASESQVRLLLQLPNFDYEVFEGISGITKQMIDDKLAS